MRSTKIYLVENCFNNTNNVYVGKTINSREADHKKRFGKQIKYSIIEVVNSTNKLEWMPVEQKWIQYYKDKGYNVMNGNRGGGGPEHSTKERNNRISKAMLNQPASRGEKISKALKGRKSFHKADTGEKISKTKQGIEITWSNKISKSMKGNTNKRGYVTPPEVRAKISKAVRNAKSKAIK